MRVTNLFWVAETIASDAAYPAYPEQMIFHQLDLAKLECAVRCVLRSEPLLRARFVGDKQD